jgi:hypothetical protein
MGVEVSGRPGREVQIGLLGGLAGVVLLLSTFTMSIDIENMSLNTLNTYKQAGRKRQNTRLTQFGSLSR